MQCRQIHLDSSRVCQKGTIGCVTNHEGPRSPHWFTTYSGTRFYPLDPKPEEISPIDIAHHLSNVCRFGGACVEHFSVAQHSVNVAFCVRDIAPEHALYALLHDAAEAYLGDMVRPLKHAKGMADFRNAEAQLMIRVCERFGLPEEEPAIVREIDLRMCVTEAPIVLPKGFELWDVPVPPIPKEEWPAGMSLESTLPIIAEHRFLNFLAMHGRSKLSATDLEVVQGRVFDIEVDLADLQNKLAMWALAR